MAQKHFAKRSDQERSLELIHSVYCMAISPENLPGSPEDIPHEIRTDLAIAYYTRNVDGEHTVTSTVTNRLLEENGIDAEALKEAAWKNTLERKHAVFMPLATVLEEAEEEDTPLFILSNEDLYLGAVTIFYPGLLGIIAEKLGCDLFVLPSSIHECLIVPASGETDASGLRKIVCKVNDAEVPKRDRLSYQVYRYDRQKEMLFVDNS